MNLKVLKVKLNCGLIVAFLLLSGCTTSPDDGQSYVDHRFPAYAQPVFHTYEYEQRTIRFAEIGALGKPLVVFVHGSPGNWKAFERLLRDDELQEKAHLVAVDRPGFGGSGYGHFERGGKQ